MSPSATPATQNYITTCFDAFEKESLCRFPHRHGDGRRKPEHQDETCWSLEQFVRDCLNFSHFVASKSAFFYEFSHEPRNLLPQNQCFVWGFHQFSSCVLKHHAAIRKKHATRHVRSAAPATKNASSENDAKILHLPHKKNEFRHVMKHVGMSKYHACHVKRGYATFETSKSDHFCRTRHRHGHSDLIVNGCRRLPTVADGCGRRSGVERARLHTRPPK